MAMSDGEGSSSGFGTAGRGRSRRIASLIADTIDYAIGIVSDKQRPVLADRDAGKPGQIAILGARVLDQEALQERLEFDRLAVLEVNPDDFIAARRPAVPRPRIAMNASPLYSDGKALPS